MSENVARKRRVSVRRIIQTLLTMSVTTACVLMLGSASKVQKQGLVTGVDIRIDNERQLSFVDRDEVMAIAFVRRHINPLQTQVSELNLRAMEDVLQSNPWLSKARVYLDNQRVLHIHVSQREPAIRVFQTDGASYYLDEELKQLPLAKDYAAYLPVVTGVPPLANDSMSDACKKELAWMVNTISASEFWKAQTAQIAMTAYGQYELIPVIGDQRILLGDTSNMDDKLARLMIFYQQVSTKIGWEQYRTIDLRFTGQVVAAPALKWKVPVDRAVANMNWVDAIMAESKADPGMPALNAQSRAANASAQTALQAAAAGVQATAAKPKAAPAAASSPKPKSNPPATPVR